MNRLQFLFETEVKPAVTHLKHLEHLEDMGHKFGSHGAHMALGALTKVHQAIKTGKTSILISVKKDGSPSIALGHHPETGKFFVASKSAFNKTPKINYTDADIEANHGHAPGLVSKLKEALHHMKKVVPPTGIYQGDFMHSHHELTTHGNHVSFTPNTITYSVHKDSDEGKKALASKMGFVTHTKYEGKTLADLKASPLTDHSGFKQHKDVHQISPALDVAKLHHSNENEEAFNKHFHAAKNLIAKANPSTFDHVRKHEGDISTYINHTVRHNLTPSHEGFVSHVASQYAKGAEKLKTKAGRAKLMKRANEHISELEHNSHKTMNYFTIHHHLSKAKDALVNTLSSHSTYHHSIKGVNAKPEGFVAVHQGYPIKLVDRKEFSASNFANRG